MTERKRVSLNTLHAASLALIAILLAVSVASYWVSNKITWPFTSGLCEIHIHRGGVFITWLDYSRGGNVTVNKLWTSEYSDDAYVWPEFNVSMWNKQVFFGCAFVGGNGYTAARLPIALAILVLMLCSVWWMRHPQRQPRKHVGYCVSCGYDLRGSAANDARNVVNRSHSMRYKILPHRRSRRRYSLSRIVPAPAPWMAPQHPPQRQPCPPSRPVLVDRVNSVLAARRMKPALPAEQAT